MKVAVVGAGFAGLSAAKVLRQSGFDVTVFEQAPDVGGVWSSTRRYPGPRRKQRSPVLRQSSAPLVRSRSNLLRFRTKPARASSPIS
jgi:cation diffusion facilitator CzcD-associated flavoprotein CzcO